jgi:tetratricopeptide (TPR) repeat protein
MRDREDQLLAILDREPHLVVLDGLERELVAYSRLDAAHLSDDDLDAKTAHHIARPAGLPDPAAHSLVGDAKLRQTIDPHTGHFLSRLTQVRAARILVTTRLFPFELEDFNGEPLPGTFVRFLSGLRDDDALELWRSAGISGERDVLLPLFRSFDGHPLLVRALTGEIARDRRSPGDFEKWRKRHPDFNPFALPLVQRKAHVLQYALEGVSSEDLALLRAIAGFRMPAAYETLAALLVGVDRATRPFPNDETFDRALAELDDRGLLGWDRRANRYDLHPIVRGVVWSGASEDDRLGIAERMRAHFKPMPAKHPTFVKVMPLDDFTPAIELYVSLIRLRRFDEAFDLFSPHVETPTLFWFGAARQRVELLEMLFPDGIEQAPRLQRPQAQAAALDLMGLGLTDGGQPGRALSYYHRAVGLETSDETAYVHFSNALRLSGALHQAEATAFRALRLSSNFSRAFPCRTAIGLSRATRGFQDGDVALHLTCLGRRFGGAEASAHLAQSALWRGEAVAALPLADRAWDWGWPMLERERLFAARLQGDAAVELGDLERADDRLHHALTLARGVNCVEEELAALRALAALHLRRGDPAHAREHLDAVWDAAERGPYPLLHADALNVLAEIEITENNIPAAIAAATAAYRLAWCDGPPFAYDCGLRTARAHQRALGAQEPEMLPHDVSKHEPIEEIDIEDIGIEPSDEPTA